jgi:hypothetical protein
MVSNGAIAHPIQCMRCITNTRAVRGYFDKTWAIVSLEVMASRMFVLTSAGCRIGTSKSCDAPGAPSIPRPRSIVVALAQRAIGGEFGLFFRKVFGNGHERVGLRQDDPLASAANDAVFLPGAQHPADGIECRPGHLRDILP